jgi:hypothetical protein
VVEMGQWGGALGWREWLSGGGSGSEIKA